MIGILCDERKEGMYTERLHAILNRIKTDINEDIVTFKLSKIDFRKGEIEGNQITGEKVKKVNAALPKVIFNFSLQKTPANIKRLRYLTKVDGVTVINNVNRFDQWMLMGMLSSSDKTNSYVLPYHIYNKRLKDYIPEDTKNYLAMPSRGSSLSRVIYAKQDTDSESVEGSQYFKKGHICDYIDASLCQKRWIFIEIPDIINSYNYPFVIRCYMQKGQKGTWTILGKSTYPRENMDVEKYSEKIDEASIDIAKRINNYMPDIGHCFIDFTIDTEANPYFLHFGGFDKRILFRLQSRSFYKQLFENMMDFSKFLTAH